MKKIDSGLQAHLEAGATTLCRCWRVERPDGAVLGFTDHDRTLTFDGVDYEPQSGFTGSEIQSSLGLAVDTQEVDGALSSARITNDDLLRGLWDGATVTLYLVNWSTLGERLLLRKATIGEVSRGDLAFTAELRGLVPCARPGTGPHLSS